MDIFPEALEHFQKLLQFNTANPPGNEWECIKYIHNILKEHGLDSHVLESAANRGNLVCRIKGDGTKKPLLITSHVDVVNVEENKWRYPPFSGAIAEGCIWGRGAIDMKNMTAFCLATMIAAKRSGWKLKRDLIMSAVSDEEVGGAVGMAWMADKHPELIRAEYAIGELGGYTLHVKGKRIYPIQAGEKGVAWINVRFHGDPGHGSYCKLTNAHFKLARFLQKIEMSPMPAHLTPVAEAFLDGLSKALGPVQGLPIKLLKSGMGPRLLLKQESRQPHEGDRFASIRAMISNTVNPTGVQSGKQHNVVPSLVTLKLDCRLLPGFGLEQLMSEIENLVETKLDYEVVTVTSGHENPLDTPLFRLICKNTAEADPGSHVIPMLTVGFTDAHYLKKLGVHCYGFTPVKLPADMPFPQLYHGHNERVPVEGFRWGLDLFLKTVQEFVSQ